jgi:GNAT superfamily N-acetyltransferase
MRYRSASERDIDVLATLHAESWRMNYRGAFSDEFLDGEVFEERRAVWSDRLSHPGPDDHTVIAEEDDVIVGFVHTILDHDPIWGALLDNLHVAHHLQGSGVGTQLMARSASAVLTRGRHRALYLWVLEGNTRAQRFYEARGGVCAGREVWQPPGGGSAVGLRYVWADPSVLL